MSARLFIIGRGATAERLCELGGALGYAEIRLIDGVPDDVRAADHVVVAEEDPRRGQDLLVAAAGREPAPAYLGFAAPFAEGQRALCHLAAQRLPAGRLEFVCAPAGVDVGALTPDEVAIAVAAELVAVRRGRMGGLVDAARPAPRRTGTDN
jgi:xanthine/CO dehydrogenase XdhC/CoxF family maturation factor